MKLLLCALLCAFALSAQQLKFTYTADLKTANPNLPLPNPFPFPATPIGDSSTILVNITNAGVTSVEIFHVCVGAVVGTCDDVYPNSNFTVDGGNVDKTLAPNNSGNYAVYVHFTPTNPSPGAAYLQVFTIENPTNPVTAPLTGTATSEQLRLTYNTGAGDVMFYPYRSSRLNFGDVSTSAKLTVTFTLTNESDASIATPAIAITAGTYTSSAFVLDTSTLPSTLAPHQPAAFTVTFAPGQTGLTTATLTIGSDNSYGIQGFGVVVDPADALQIYYVDATGVRTLPQAATPISFGQVVPGTAASSLTFTVANPATSFSAITVSKISVTGSAFTLSGVPSLPASIQPGSSIQFVLSFKAATSGTYTGTLSIGARTFSLTGLAVVSPVPAMSLHFNSTPLSSGQQVAVTVQAATPSNGDHLGTLSMQFTPSVAGVTDDPAVAFLNPYTRTLSLELLPGAQTATYQGQSALAFQTGTTAGTLTFTLNFPNTPPLTQTFTLTPAQIHISTATAERQDPYLVLTINGFDNTYSAGKMAFTFYDLNGKAINATPIDVDATTDFHNYFFTSNQAGGAFAMQAKFPIKGGDIKQVGSVGVTLYNSAGQTTQTLQFQ